MMQPAAVGRFTLGFGPDFSRVRFQKYCGNLGDLAILPDFGVVILSRNHWFLKYLRVRLLFAHFGLTGLATVAMWQPCVRPIPAISLFVGGRNEPAAAATLNESAELRLP